MMRSKAEENEDAQRRLTVPYVLHFAQQHHGEAGLALAAEMMLLLEDLLKDARKRAGVGGYPATIRLALHRIIEARIAMR